MSFLTSSLIGPVGAIALCLFYFDTRVRKEGFDIEALMDRTIGSPLGPVAESPVLLPSGFAPSGFTAVAGPVAPSGFVGSSPFAASGFTAPSAEVPKVEITPETPETERS
jgi:hypothetical protein